MFKTEYFSEAEQNEFYQELKESAAVREEFYVEDVLQVEAVDLEGEDE